MNVPTGLQLVSETIGFVETKGSLGLCFEWYQFVNGSWKQTHILHEENWLLANCKNSNENT